jgi:hypothetical protein
MTKQLNRMVLTVGPNYSVPTHYIGRDAVTLHEWIGRSAEDFTKAMRREPDQVREIVLDGYSKITEYIWNK